MLAILCAVLVESWKQEHYVFVVKVDVDVLYQAPLYFLLPFLMYLENKVQ